MRAAQLYIKETGKYIQLGQDGDFPFTLSKSIAEIQDVSKRNKTFSKSFKIPATEDNVKALGYAHVIGTDLDAVNVYKQQCLVIVNGNVIDDGYVYILKAKRETDAIEFECQFVGGNESWVVALQSLKMSDMTTNTSGTVLQLAYTDANILARVVADPRTMADPSYIFVNPYMYQFSDGEAQNYDSTETYEGQSRYAEGNDFWPAFRLDYLIDGIFGTATNPLVQSVFGFDSFELDSDFLTDNATHGFWDNIYYSDRSQDDYPNVTFGATEDWRFFLPTEVTMLDFFMNVCKTFNLVFTFDGITLKVEPRNDWTSWNGTTYTGFYSGDIDWSDKVSVEQEIQYKTSKYKRQVRLSWETESYPIDDNMYPFINDKNVSQPEVRYIIDLDSNNDEGITDIKLPFNTSLSKFYQAKFDFRRTREIKANAVGTEQEKRFLIASDGITFNPDRSYSNRLFVFKVGTAPMGIMYYGTDSSSYDFVESYLYRPQWREWIYEDAGGTEHNQSNWPFMYNCMTIDPYNHRNQNIFISGGSVTTYNVVYQSYADWDAIENVDVSDVTITRQPSDATDLGRVTDIESNSIDDINLGIYKSNTVDMPDGLYERFWKTTIDQLITTRTLVTQVLMTRNEFVSLDISKYYTLMGQRFILNKVKDFDPMLDEQMVDVELLAVDAFRSSDIPSENIVTSGLIFRVDAGDTASYGGTGTTWIDVINGNNGTINNGAAYNAAQGGYFEFDGVDDQVDFGQPAILETYPFSIDIWFYSSNDQDSVITKGTSRGSSSTRDWDIFGAGGPASLRYLVSTGSTNTVVIGATYPSLNNWHHLSVSWDGTTGTNGAKMYLDGALFAQGTASSTVFSTAHNIFAGGNRTGFYLDGRISMIKMYDKVLSASEALQNYNASKDRYGL